MKKENDLTKTVAGIEVPVDLHPNGFEYRKSTERDFDEKSIEAARKIIRENLEKSPKVSKDKSSYGYKHVVEDVMGDYLANGELIVAMIGEGFSFKRDDINCFFNVTKKSLKKLTDLRQETLNASRQ